VTNFWNFGTPETSNLAARRMVVSTNEKSAKLGQKWSCGGHETQFWNFEIPLISREPLKLETSNWHGDEWQ